MWTEHVKSCYQDNIKPSANVHIALLDINTEGKLHREIKDIIEETDIMLYITRAQKDVLRNYMSQVEEIINPAGDLGSRATTWTVDEDKRITEFKAAPRGPKARSPSKDRSTLPSYVKREEGFD